MSFTSFFFRSLALLYLCATVTLHAAVLDDLVEKIQHKTTIKGHKHRKHHRRHHARHLLSQEAQYQKALQFLGYYHGKIDGDLSTPSSFDAIMAFHAKHNEIKTGFLEKEDKPYLSGIYRTITLKKYLSYKGKRKKRKYQKLQAALALQSLYKGKIDGRFGKMSKKAFKRYKAQLDTNASLTKKEIEQKLIDESRDKMETEIAEIKKDNFDPQIYATDSAGKDLLTE